MISRTTLVLCAAALWTALLTPRPVIGAEGGAPSTTARSILELHNKFTALRPKTAQCAERAANLLDTLRQVLAKYKDSKAAQAAGYAAYYADHDLPIYHFASKWRAFKELVRFDPAQPTALLYEKAAGHFELVGVMYYAPGRYSEDSLDQRVPLCVARWHRQVNVCLPPGGTEAQTDPRFSADGTIATQAECKAAGGSWNPEIHGWMVEVYPFEHDPKKIWAYRPD
jgi:hypothetical protein